MYSSNAPSLIGFERDAGSGRRLAYGSLAASIGLALLVIAFTGYGIWQGHDEAIAAAKHNALNLARVVARNTELGIRAIDLNLVTTEQVFRKFPSGLPATPEQIDWLLHGRLRLMPDVRTLLTTDRNGVMIHAASDHPPRLGASLADREYFIWHRDHGTDTVHIGPPIASQVVDSSYIPVSRRLTAPDGEFDGVIVAALEPKKLQEFYASVNMGEGGLIGIFLRDGTLLARGPYIEGMLGKSFADIPLFREHLPVAAEGSYRLSSRSDGKPRISSYTTVPGTGLVVTAAYGEAEILASWRRQVATDLTALLVFLLVLSGLTFVLLRQLQRQQMAIGVLQRSEARYRRLIGTANEGIWQMDAKHRTTFVNPQVCAMLGYSEAEILGKSMGDFVREPRQLQVPSATAQQSEAAAHFDESYRRKDGTLLHTITAVSSTFDQEGHYAGALVMLTDITARAKAEEEVRQQLLRLEALHAIDRAILEARSSEEIATIGLDYIRRLVPYWGMAMLAFDHAAGEAVMLGFVRAGDTKVEIPPRMTLAEYGLDDIALLQSGAERVVTDTGELPAPSILLQRLMARGMRSFVRVPLLVENELVGAINIGCDTVGALNPGQVAIVRTIADPLAIALRQAALRGQVEQQAAVLEQRVAERTAELVAFNRELESFTSSVTHDLRAPVRNIGGFASMLLEDTSKLDASSVGTLQRITRAATQMDGLINDLMSLARTGAGELHKVNVDMNALVSELRDDLASQIGARQVEWKVADLPPANGDPALIRVAMQNLLNNAVKYSSKREQAVIEVGTRTEEHGEKAYFVRDNGAGFDMIHADKLFKVFSRLHSKRDFDGTGVGLVTVQRVVSRHGGRIRANSKPGEGAEFSFTLG